MTSKGDNANIDIFMRIRPVKAPSPRVVVDLNENKVEFNIPREASAGYVNNQREQYEFRFNGIITPEAKQDEVFERVARNVVMGAMEGFNGTIFAYGQTGSGKTFTITGGPERYVDRGIIPRSISAIFSEISKRADYQYSVHISYLEIYNETGYDLLDPNREVKAMEDLPQVHVMEDDEHIIHYRNLSVHLANNEEEALNLLFLGDTNRTISETPMNMASSRSHCVFTIYIEARRSGEDTVRRSKLNLVDLAGSERVSKTGVNGTTLTEAKFINLSLHYLEQVIIALQERAMGMNRPHIPYRNSMMTTALKDSLGGNCRTVMVATINSEQNQLDESISTCRFAMRVALVRNQVLLNEEMDPSSIIRRLKAEVRGLKDELRLLKGEDEERGPLTPDELQRLRTQIESWCTDPAPDSELGLGGSMMMIRASLSILKEIVRSGGALKSLGGSTVSGKAAGTPGAAGAGAPGGGELSADAQEQIRKLRLQVAQRDNEINILVSMLKRREGAKAGPLLASTAGGLLDPAAAGPRPAAGPLPPGARAPPGDAASSSSSMEGPLSGRGGDARAAAAAAAEARAAAAVEAGPSPGGGGGAGDEIAALMNTNLLADRNKAFELFRKSYRQNEVIEENKALLKTKYDSAKSLKEEVNDSKQRITELKALIEQRRVQRAVGGDAEAAGVEDPEEERCKELIEKEKNRYKDAFNQLRDLRSEIEHLHMLLEQSRTRLQRDFEQWLGLMARQQQQQQQQMGGDGSGVPLMGSPGPMMGNGYPGSNGMSTSASPSHLGSGASTPVRSSSTGPLVGAGGAVRPSPPGGGYGGGYGLPGGPASSPVPGAPRQAWGEANASPATSQGSLAGMSKAVAAGRPRVDVTQGVDPRVLELARPHLTGDPTADADIIGFYEAKAKMMAHMNK